MLDKSMKYIISTKKQEFSKIILISMLCMYINNPFYISAIEKINKIIYYCIALSPIFSAVHYYIVTVKRGVLNYICYIVFYIVCAYAITIISGSHDMQYMIYFFRHLLGIFAMYAVYMAWLKAYKQNKILVRFEEIYIISLILYIVSTIIFLVIPELRNIWMNIISHYGHNEALTNRQEYITRIGIAGYSGFGVAFQTVMGLIYYVAMYINNRLSPKKKVFYLIGLLIGCMFYGRIGTVIGVVIIGFISIYIFLYKKNIKLFLSVVFSVIIIGVIMIGIYKYASGSAKDFVDWAFEPIINYVENGTLSSASTSDLAQSYQEFNPPNEILWHGTGYWLNENGSYYGHTDVGFMRNIYYGGIIYTFFTYGCVLYLIFEYFRLAKKYGHKGRRLIFILCIIVFVAFEMKGDITFTFVQAFLPLYFGVYFSDNIIIDLLYLKKERVDIK